MADAFMAIFDFKPVEEPMCNFDSGYYEEGKTNLSCASCVSSIFMANGSGNGLWCATHNRPANEECGDFEYCPGTDETERG
jgi:hypothetical protein